MGRLDIEGKKLLRALGIAAFLFVAVLALRGGFSPEDRASFLSALCDAFFVSGVLLTGAALLTIFAGIGAFTGLTYPTMKALSMLRREEKRREMPRTYYDYVEKRAQSPRRRPVELLLTGIILLVGAGVTMAVIA